MISIASPISSFKEVDRIIKTGASEIYCGLVTEESRKVNGPFLTFNSRNINKGNIQGIRELKQVLNAAHSKGVPVSVAYNSFYWDYQYPVLLKEIGSVIKMGADALIVCDLKLILLLRERFPQFPLYLSTRGATLNVYSVSFYEELGIKRIILPRCLSLKEIDEISKSCNIDFEVIILKEGCYFLEGFCDLEHNIASLNSPALWNLMDNFVQILNKIKGVVKIDNRFLDITRRFLRFQFPPCLYNFRCKEVSNGKRAAISDNLSFYENCNTFFYSCDVCRLFYLKNISKVKILKISGRSCLSVEKIANTRFLNETLKILDHCSDERIFRLRIRRIFRSIYKRDCSESFCYCHS